jgi:hypothetical protein
MNREYTTVSDVIFEQLFSPNEWMQFSLSLLKLLPIEEAVVLSYLIGVSRRAKAYKRKDGWFYAKASKIMRTFRISEYTQTRIIKKLAAKKFIVIKRRGIPCVRWMRINLGKLILASMDDNVELAKRFFAPVPKDSKGLAPKDSKGHKVNVNVLSFGNTNRGNTPKTFEEHCCQYMKDAIHNETRRIVKWKIKKQACHIKAIANQYKDKEEFLDIFEWYCQNIGNTKEFNLPVCYSPKELRNPNVWNWIENKRTKYDKKNEDVPITDEAKTICKTLNMMHWPKGSKEQLPKLVQLGLNEYTTFVKRLKKYFKKLEEGDLWYFYVHHLIRKLPAPSHFIENWFRDLNSMVRSWDKWNGDLAKYGFTLKQEHFLSRLRGLTVEYGRKGKDFDTLMEKVMNEN